MSTRGPLAACGLLALTLLLPPAPAAHAAPADSDDGAHAAFTIRDPEITESSGLAASHRHPGVYWTHNDNAPGGGSQPFLYAVDSDTGETLAKITLDGPGVQARDLEAVSLGPNGDLYVGDIGDNQGGAWEEVWIYRLPEPAHLADATIAPTVYRVRYEDGPRDAEALMVHPETGRVYVASKVRDGDAALYAAPEDGLAEGTDAVTTLERVADIDLWVTDGAFSPDGTRLFLRGYFTSQMYDFTDGTPEPIRRQVPMPLQEQGESVTFTPDGTTLMFGSEGRDSTVEPVKLQGELLPESARSQEDDAADGDDAADEDDAADGEAAAGGDDDGFSGGAAAIVIAIIVLFLASSRVNNR